jgi:hypothetical protein
VPPSNHHHCVATVGAARVARFKSLARLLDFDSTMYGDSSGFHNNVVVNRFGSVNHRLDLFDRPSERDRQLFVVCVKALIT